MQDMPRVLVISNTALKRSNSNGLSILNVLSAIPASHIASFFIQDAFPDRGVASTHFRLTDSEKLRGFFFGRHDGLVIRDNDIPDAKECKDIQDTSVKGKESFFRHDVRDFVWKRGYWNKKKLYQWVAEFAPTAILFMNGRSPFMFDITRGLAERFKLPVVYYSSEDEYWHPPINPWDKILRTRLKKSTLKLNKYVKHVVAFHDKLGKMYENEFHLPVSVIMPSSSLEPVAHISKDGNWLYAGNLKPYRYESLADIAQTLHSIDPSKVIDVYSNDVDEEIQLSLKSCSNLVLHDAVGRDELDVIRRQAFVLLHIESFSEEAVPLIQNAFSSKIADCLALGIPFFVYAPSYCGFAPYFEKHSDAVCYASSKEELILALAALMRDPMICETMRAAAIKLARENHNQEANAERMREILSSVVVTSKEKVRKNV